MQMKTCVHLRACVNSAATWLRNGVRHIRGLQMGAHAAFASTQTEFKCFDMRRRRAQMRTKKTQGCPTSSHVVPVFSFPSLSVSLSLTFSLSHSLSLSPSTSLSPSLSHSEAPAALPLAVSNAAVWVSWKNLSQILNRSRIAHNHTLNK